MTQSQPLSDSSNIRATKSPENIFKIMIATDIHLGYGEKDPTIADDSFTTFEEILQIAHSRNVDFILLAGDLFHDAEPSIKTMNECIRLLRMYVLGDREIKFDFLSDQHANFPSSLTQGVNYEDSNLNISVPLFTIHGNHDDLINNTSALDVLSSTGLINYFGQWKELSNIKISPIILRKGDTKLALYGLNHIPDRRLYSLINSNQFNITIPEVMDDVFCMFVLHQNRADRGQSNYIMEKMLPSFLHLVIWGHEHDCRIEPEPCNNTFICQPGSSVATSLSEGESIEKKVGILEIRGKQFKMTPVALRTVRPFVFRSIDIKDYEEHLEGLTGDMRYRVEKLLDGIVKEMLEEAEKKLTGHAKQPKLPLIRLRVMYENNNYLINPKRFGQNNIGIVANPEDMLLFKKILQPRLKPVKHEPNKDVLDAAINQREAHDRVEDVVSNYFKDLVEEKQKLKLLNLESLTEACQMLVDREDENGAEAILNHQFEAACKFLSENEVPEDRLDDAIGHFNERESKNALEEAKRLVEENRAAGIVNPPSDEEAESNGPPVKKATRGRGRGRGAASTSSAANTSTSSRSARGGRKNATAAKQPSIAQQLAHRSTQNKSARYNTLFNSDDSDED